MLVSERIRWSGFAGVATLAAVTLLNSAVPCPGWLQTLLLAAGLAGMGSLVLAWGLLGRQILHAETPRGGANPSDTAKPGPLRWLCARVDATATPGGLLTESSGGLSGERPVERSGESPGESPGGRPSAAWLKRTLALWAAPLLVAPPLFSGDVYSYLAQGATAARGLDPYTLGPAQALGAGSDLVQRVSALWRDTPSPYGPLFTVLQRGVARTVGDHPVLGVVAYRALAVAGLLLIVWSLPRLARATGVSASKALWLGALNPLVLWHFVAGVHNDALMIGLMVAGTALALGAIAAEKLDPAGLAAGILVIALGAEVKLPALAAFAVVGVALAKRYRGGWPRLVFIATGLAFCFAGVSIVVSVLGGTGFGWTRTLGTSGVVDSWMAPTNWFGFLAGGYGALFGEHLLQPMIGVGRFLGALFALAGVGYLVRRQLTRGTAAVAALGGVLAVIVVFGPVVQPWYLLWAAVPLAAGLRVKRPFVGVAGLSAVFAVLLPPLGVHNLGMLVLGYGGGLVALSAAAYGLTRPVAERRLESVAS